MTTAVRHYPLPLAEKTTTMGGSAGKCKATTTLATERQLWSDTYARHHRELVLYLQGKWRKETPEAEDIVHQAFERYMLVAEPHKIEQPRAYLFQLVRNLAVDGLRKEQVRAEHRHNQWQEDNAETSASPEHTLLTQERLRELQQIIETLPTKRRRAFILNRIHHMSYAEIAKEMSISKDGVKKHILRALEICQAHLRKRFGEPSARDKEEPSAKNQKEPSAKNQKEPSAKNQKEPSAKNQKEPSAKNQKEPSAKNQKEPSVKTVADPAKTDKKPSGKVDREHS